jgi:serine/threonine protein kinase
MSTEISDASTDELSISSDENIDYSDNLELSGEILKNYNVINELGRGSYSIVWLVFNICDNNFYALKVQNPVEYESGIDEIKFVSRLPKTPNVFNNLVEYFIEKRDNKKFICSVWKLHCSNIDSLLRKGNFKNGFQLSDVKNIMRQLICAIKILHNRFKVFHGDIKTDNILIKGFNDYDKFIIESYYNENFFEKYNQEKEKYWTSIGKNIKDIAKMKKKDKLKIRIKIHQNITQKILMECEKLNIQPYNVSNYYLNPINISLADFGTCCEENNFYEETFGTRYYQAPEIILMGKCSYPVDIWALGCTFYELLSGNILFDPIKDAQYSRDYYHLCLINETCGYFPIKFIQKTKHHKIFFNSKGKIIDYELPSKSRLDRKLDDIQVNEHDKSMIKEILINMLAIDPAKRWTINEVANHSFFN